MKMTIFLTSTAGETEGPAFVAWRSGLDRGGDITVDLKHSGLSGSRVLIAAELAAIRFLILEKKIFGESATKGVGNGIDIVTTRGAIKKVWLDKGNTDDIAGFVFFQQRLPNLTIKAEKSVNTDLSEGNERLQDHIEAESMMYEVFDTELGEVEITRHALEQYEQRLNQVNNGANNYLSSLLKHLRNSKIRKVQLPSEVMRHKARKYGADDNAEHWNVPGSRWHYVIKPSTERSSAKRVVTAYVTGTNRVS